MNSNYKINIILLLGTLCFACTSAPLPIENSSPSADSQKSKAEQAQKELAAEISKQQ